MKKKLVSILTAGAVVSAMAAGCVAVSADSTVESAAESAAEAAVAPETVGTGSKGTIKIWVADAAVKFTSQQGRASSTAPTAQRTGPIRWNR